MYMYFYFILFLFETNEKLLVDVTIIKHISVFFYAPEGTSGGILKSHHLSVRPSVSPSVTNRVSAITH